MPFGRYRGRNVSELDDDYLDWLLTRCENIPDDLRAELEAEEKKRYGTQGQGILHKKPTNFVGKPLCHEIVQLGLLQKLTKITSKAEADAVLAAADYIRRELGL